MHTSIVALAGAGVLALVLTTSGCTSAAANTGVSAVQQSPTAQAAGLRSMAPQGSTTHPVSQSRFTLPPTSGFFDYQLGGGYPPAKGVTVVTRDSTDSPAQGVYSICYVNGFQTQPGESWPDSLILHTADGKPLVDAGWPDEHIIDTSTASKRAAVAARQQTVVASCAKKGFKAIEFDNLDSWTRSKSMLTEADAIALAKLLVSAAHARGLAASQKNAADLAKVGKQTIGFDFATTEECDRFSECGEYTKVYGPHVLDIEYSDDLRGTFGAICKRPSTPKQTVLRDHNLLTPSQGGYVFAYCLLTF